MLILGELPSLLGESLNSSQSWLVTSLIGTPSDPTTLFLWTNMVTVSNKQSLGPLKGKKSVIGILQAEWISSNTTSTLSILSAATKNMHCESSNIYKNLCNTLTALVKIHIHYAT